MRIISTGFTHRGGTRDHNEDAYLEASEAQVWVVADGMGGYQAGDIASQLICDTVNAHIRNTSVGSLTPQIISQSLVDANKKIRDYREQFLNNETVGSTVVTLMISGSHYYISWVGDSRCYLLRNNQLQQLSKDHSQVADMVEKGLISADKAEQHPLANVITRAVGVDKSLQIDTISGVIETGDIFLLCSDGISKEFPNNELLSFIAGGDLEESSQAIMHSALVKKSKDNITCILVKAEEDWYSDGLRDQSNDDATVPLFPNSKVAKPFK